MKLERGIGVGSVAMLAAFAVDAGAQPLPVGRLHDVGAALERPSLPHKELRARIPAASAAKLKEALKADPRVKALSAEILAATKIPDKARRNLELEKLAPRIRAVRADVMAKAGIEPSAVEQGVKSVALPAGFEAAAAALVPPPGSVLGTATIGSFPKPFSFKQQCPDEADKVDFDGATAKLRASSAPFDEDCWFIRAGRTGSVQVPKGAAKMKLDLRAKVDLDVVGIHFGTFAEVWGDFGVRLFSPKGVTLSTVEVAGQKVAVPGAVKLLRRVHTRSVGISPIPFTSSGFEDDIQPGDAYSTVTFDLPPGAELGELEVTLFTSAEVDADLSGVATASNDITPKSVAVTFLR